MATDREIRAQINGYIEDGAHTEIEIIEGVTRIHGYDPSDVARVLTDMRLAGEVAPILPEPVRYSDRDDDWADEAPLLALALPLDGMDEATRYRRAFEAMWRASIDALGSATQPNAQLRMRSHLLVGMQVADRYVGVSQREVAS